MQFDPARSRIGRGVQNKSPLSPTVSADPFELLRGIDPVAKGRIWLKTGSGKMASWDHLWGEIRGTMLVFRDIDEVLKSIENPVPRTPVEFLKIACVSGVDVEVKRKWGHENYLKISKGESKISIKFDDQKVFECFRSVLFMLAPRSIPSLHDYRLITAIGAGATGRVFLVEDRRTGEILAMKSVDKDTAVMDSQTSYRHAVDERLLFEKLGNRHPYCCEMKSSFQTVRSLYYTFPFYEGGDLFFHLYSKKLTITEHTAKYLLAQVILAIEELHKHGYIYRDLKPENILLEKEGFVRLCDFGLSKRLDKGIPLGRTNSLCGTHAYVAPEMIFDGIYGHSVDFWTLGVFLYQILCGKTPFRACSLAEVEINLKGGFAWGAEELSRDARSLILGLLARDPNERLGSERGFEEVKSHAFFTGVDWVGLRQGRLPEDGLLFYPDRYTEDGVQGKNPSESLLTKNFDLNEWQGLTLLEDDDPDSFTDSSLWPPADIRKFPLATRLLIGFGSDGPLSLLESSCK
eukprot:CAMPEP_0184679806 /NCGR_PEP_ID=MMETSP0312-20130426/2678_1 /TAXON_ID=31354 /ORGANISM="Compsopogon coeruleus, Strain SAG 36.94" /LENGTH=517 /DNA_ID=CAMNT_0027129509 /DNA_START=475 /DNA_END=2028 /DNA_ORIENTATION=+